MGKIRQKLVFTGNTVQNFVSNQIQTVILD